MEEKKVKDEVSKRKRLEQEMRDEVKFNEDLEREKSLALLEKQQKSSKTERMSQESNKQNK